MVKAITRSRRNIFPVIDENRRINGVLFLDDVREVMFDRDKYETTTVDDYEKAAPTVVGEDEKMESVMEKFEETGAWNLPVVDSEGRYLGFVSKSKIFSAYRTKLQQVSHD